MVKLPLCGGKFVVVQIGSRDKVLQKELDREKLLQEEEEEQEEEQEEEEEVSKEEVSVSRAYSVDVKSLSDLDDLDNDDNDDDDDDDGTEDEQLDDGVIFW
jgi:hypothetical protein